jgi:hypothetical protein
VADDRLGLLMEAERRGLALDAEDIALLAEARRRGLVETVSPSPPDPKDLIARGITGSGFGMRGFATPVQRVEGAANALRVASGLTGFPLSIATSAAGEAVAQAAEQGVGAREGFDPVSIGVAGALPPLVAGAARVVRGIGRTVTRTIPSVFQRAQEGARAAGDDVAASLTPETSAAQLFKAARGTGETVPAGRITAILDDLDQTIPQDPANAGLKQVREYMTRLRGAVKADGTVDLPELMRQRLDLGREIARGGSAPELRALYGHGGDKAKGLIGALEEAADAGGAGASAAREALTVFKRDLGVMKWRDLVEQATKRTSISGVDTPAVNIAKLGNLVEKHGDELTAQLGPEGMALVRGYLTKFRTLPPTHAATAARSLIAVMAGGAAGINFGSIPIGLGAALLPEIATNVYAVGRNPIWVNQLMAGLAQATRAGVTPMVAPFNPPRVNVGPEARELARR